MTDTQRFRYQISTRLLIVGLVMLGFALVLLLVMAIEGEMGLMWWLLTGTLGPIFALTAVVTASNARHGPIEVAVTADGVDVPIGTLGTRTQSLKWADLKALRLVGRESMFKNERNREVAYLVHQTGYTILISDLFESMAHYMDCRTLLLGRIQAACPDLRIDIDGKIIQGGDQSDEDAVVTVNGSDSNTV